jgi:DegV family protein with EDD domain
MEYLTQNELKRMLLLSYERIEEKKEEINKINVFPVPDQDTGTNLAKTLEGIKKEIEGKEFKDLEEISKAALDGALISAQGNAGVIYTGFLAGFLPKLDKNPVDAKKLAEAFEEGRKRAWRSMANPKQGTILDVIDAAAETFKREAEKEKDIVKIFEKVIEKAKEALLATREKMEIFKKANVVDAGGLGFLMILESYLDALRPERKKEEKKERPSEEIRRFIQVLSNRFEVVALVLDPRFDEEKVRENLKRLGNCLDIVKVENKMKIHIHTDYPDDVRDVLRKIGKIEDLRIEDMAKEIAGEPSVRKVSIGIVTDELADLTQKIIERYQIEVIPFKIDWPEGEKLKGENIYQKMREAERLGIKNLPKTAQASPKEYFEAFERQFKKGFEKILCITISSKLSGGFNSALQGREMLSGKKKEKVFVLDSQNASAGEALLVLRAIELIQAQMEIDEVLAQLEKEIPRIQLYGFLKDPKWAEWGGRVSHCQANWLRRLQKIGIRPLLGLKEGEVIKIGFRIGVKEIWEAIFKEIEAKSRKIRKKGKKIRVVITHCDNLEEAKKLKEKLKEIGAEVSFINLTGPVVGVHVGPGSLIAGWMPIE